MLLTAPQRYYPYAFAGGQGPGLSANIPFVSRSPLA